MKDDCIFCKIASGIIPAERIFENDQVVAFNDIHPQAPTHVLIIPKEHYPSLNDIPAERLGVVDKIFEAAQAIAKKTGIDKEGYRIVCNTNRGAGQEIFHLHFHVMGGRALGSMG